MDCPRYSMCRYVTSAFSKPMPLHAGGVADFQRKRNGNASRANRRYGEIYSIREGCIPQRHRCGRRTTFRGLLGMDGQRLHRLSGIQAPPWSAGRIQRQVYVRPDGSARRVLRHSRESCSRDVSQLLSTSDSVAVHRNSFGKLKGFVT